MALRINGAPKGGMASASVTIGTTSQALGLTGEALGASHCLEVVRRDLVRRRVHERHYRRSISPIIESILGPACLDWGGPFQALSPLVRGRQNRLGAIHGACSLRRDSDSHDTGLVRVARTPTNR